MVPCMDFAEAYTAMCQDERRARRTVWNKGTVVGVTDPGTPGEYLYAENAEGRRTVWPVTIDDLESSDWELTL